MPKDRNLGEFEILVLAAVLRLDDNAYGSTIREEIEARTARSVTVGALYATLARMEEKRYVTSRTGESTSQRGGRAKRYYELTPLGRERFERSVAALHNMLEGVVPWREARET